MDGFPPIQIEQSCDVATWSPTSADFEESSTDSAHHPSHECVSSNVDPDFSPGASDIDFENLSNCVCFWFDFLAKCSEVMNSDQELRRFLHCF